MPVAPAPPSAPRNARELARAEMTRRILEQARGQLNITGPGELSLRAIARDLGMASSAIYRYFASRDELVTALLVEVFHEVGEVIETADARIRPRTNLGRRFREMSRALRVWAVEHPHDWALVYGSPIPGYAAPEDTVSAATRVPAAFLRLTEELQGAGRGVHSQAQVPGKAQKALGGLWQLLDHPLDSDLTYRGMIAWAAVMGAISLEVFGHLKGGVLDHEAWFDQLVATALAELDLC